MEVAEWIGSPMRNGGGSPNSWLRADRQRALQPHWHGSNYLASMSWVHVPTLVTHGTADTKVPISLSLKLKALKPSLVTLRPLPRRGPRRILEHQQRQVHRPADILPLPGRAVMPVPRGRLRRRSQPATTSTP
jgi:hypothetical protein